MATTVHDVAAAVLAKTGTISTMKLQKLVYYSQAWHLALTGERLFDEDFQAWANGPVCRPLFNRHRGYFSVSEWQGDPAMVGEFEDAIITLVINKYGSLTAAQLFAFGYSERLWGFLLQRVFYPLWWDPEHRVCGYDEDLAETITADPAAARRAADIVTSRTKPR